MRQKSGPAQEPAETVAKEIRRATRKHDAAEEKIRIVHEGRRCVRLSASRRRPVFKAAPVQ
jgi:hypothetical protein